MGKGAKTALLKVMTNMREKYPRGIPSISEVGLDTHWGATSFKAHWTQKFATHLAKTRTRVVQEIRFTRKDAYWGLRRGGAR